MPRSASVGKKSRPPPGSDKRNKPYEPGSWSPIAKSNAAKQSTRASIRKLALMQIRNGESGYFLAAYRLAAHLAFIASESFLRPAAVRPPPFFFAGALAELLPPAFLLAAQRAFIASDSFLRPAAVRPPLLLRAGFAAELLVPFRFAQRAFAAAANFARVAADMGRRVRPPRRRDRFAPPELVDPPKRVDKRCSSAEICCLRESACDSF